METPVNANEMYPDLVILAEKFGHRIEELCGVLRWDKTRNTQDLNKLAFDFQNGRVSLFDYMKTYMEIGYSLSGFEDVMTGLGQDFIDLAVRYDADMLRNAYWGNNQILLTCSSQSPMDFSEYQKRAAKTAIYPRADAVTYPTLEAGPIYGVQLIKDLPLGQMWQACPSRNELDRVREISERTVAAYETLLLLYRRQLDITFFLADRVAYYEGTTVPGEIEKAERKVDSGDEERQV